MVDLILKDIQDPYVRENFFRLSKFLNSQVWFEGDFKFFDVTIPSKDESFAIRHGLTFTPADIIPLAVTGDFNFYFEYSKFNDTYIYIKTNGAVRLRFLAGKLAKNVRDKLNPTLPSVGLGARSSPGLTFTAISAKSSPYWLTCDGIPSNITGLPILLNNAVIEQAAVGTEFSASFTIELWQHEGNFVNPLLLGNFSILSGGPQRVALNLPISYTSQDIQIACKLASGNTRNLRVSLVVKGNDL
jgi:hypothetical protein